MKVKRATLVVSNPQLALLLIGFTFFLIGPLFKGLPWVSLLGWLFLAMSWGTSVEADEKGFRFHYLFGKRSIEVPVEEVVELKVINRLTLSSLAREFPSFFLLVLGVACFSLLVLLTHPTRNYSGYTALFLVSASYLLLLLLPFEMEELGMLAFAVPIALGLFLWIIAPEATDQMMVLAGEVAVFFTYASHYSRDYIVLKTVRGKYMVAFERSVPVDAFLRTLGGRGDVQTA
ncbi:hypothetical protein [Thermococcus sp.]|uniref:hypothetical protein n=1 Tax=Thermococcus sp. TaxID=35749 RepID=UPI00261D4F91|nr:hypothetical protein [Thermococcus sp.]